MQILRTGFNRQVSVRTITVTSSLGIYSISPIIAISTTLKVLKCSYFFERKIKYISGYGPKLVEIDLNQDGRISFVEASLIGLQIHLRQAEIDNTPCIKCKPKF